MQFFTRKLDSAFHRFVWRTCYTLRTCKQFQQTFRWEIIRLKKIVISIFGNITKIWTIASGKSYFPFILILTQTKLYRKWNSFKFILLNNCELKNNTHGFSSPNGECELNKLLMCLAYSLAKSQHSTQFHFKLDTLLTSIFRMQLYVLIQKSAHITPKIGFLRYTNYLRMYFSQFPDDKWYIEPTLFCFIQWQKFKCLSIFLCRSAKHI